LNFTGSTSGTVTIQPAAIAGTYALTLPGDDGTSGQALTTDGTGVLSWTTIAASPGGSTTQLQYNDAGAFAGASGLTTNGTELTIASGTKTADAPLLNMSQTWNNAAVTFTGLKFNATDTASAAASLLMDLQVGGASRFSVTKGGSVTIPLGTSAGYGFAGGTVSLYAASNVLNIYSGALVTLVNAASSFGWSDTIISRRGTANLRFGAADAAAPVAQTLSVQSVVAGTTNTAGANLTITGSQGTGTGAGGSIIFQIAAAGTTGSAQNALVTALTIDSTRLLTAAGNLQIANNGVYIEGTAVGTVRVPGVGGYYGFTTNTSSTSGSTIDTFITRRGTANLRLGAADVGANTSTVTITIAAPGVVTWTSHGLGTGTPVVFTTTGALPTGITSGTTYYAVVVDTNTFQIASSVANAIASTPTVITTSGTQSGTHTGTRYNVTQRLSVQSVTGVTNRLGADLVITGSQGTGTGAGGSITFQTSAAGTTGTAQNALADALTLDSVGSVRVARALTVATLPGTPLAGMIARVTDALAPTIGTTVAGGGAAYALVNYNGANWTVIGV
jgi:hypothetical protein